MKTHRLLLLLAAAVAGLTDASASGLVTYDFQTETAGTAPGGAGTYVKYPDQSGYNKILVAGSATTPADLFGGAGNQSLYIQWGKQSSNNKLPVAQFDIPGYSAASPLASGTVTFDFYLVKPADGTGVVEFDLGSLTTADSARALSLAAVQVWAPSTDGINAGTVYTYSGGTSSSDAKASNATVTYGAKNTFAISWDAASDSYSILLNGVEVTSGSGASIVSSFAQSTDQAGVSAIRFTAATGGGNTAVSYFVDNITIAAAIPEPSATAAVAAGAALLGVLAVRLRR